MFSPNMHGLNIWRVKKLKQYLMVLLELKMNLNATQINYGLVKEDNFTKNVCKNC